MIKLAVTIFRFVKGGKKKKEVIKTKNEIILDTFLESYPYSVKT